MVKQNDEINNNNNALVPKNGSPSKKRVQSLMKNDPIAKRKRFVSPLVFSKILTRSDNPNVYYDCKFCNFFCTPQDDAITHIARNHVDEYNFEVKAFNSQQN